ncbi:hypothetical protein DQL45_19235 [Cereibacter sphaeroides 2.4.1]|jgi:hypothetical protein|nr:hypothetical protein DQL45_19235 [Cereibacter sphaeroides 2.4.1]RDS94804.1 hypothetical protein DWF04_15215 [Cereibacter sphaeroides f. sp. denitrificans]
MNSPEWLKPGIYGALIGAVLLGLASRPRDIHRTCGERMQIKAGSRHRGRPASVRTGQRRAVRPPRSRQSVGRSDHFSSGPA